MTLRRIRLRGGTALQWATANPILRAREPGIEQDSGRLKFGDGVTAWNDLPYATVVTDSGSFAARPAAADFGPGYYMAVDDDGGTPWYSDGISWTQWGAGVAEPSGKLLAQATWDATVFTTNIVSVDTVTQLNMLDVQVGSQPVEMQAGFPLVQHSVANGLVFIQLAVDGVSKARMIDEIRATSGYRSFYFETPALDLEPGPHDFQVWMSVATAGTGSLLAAPERPIWAKVKTC